MPTNRRKATSEDLKKEVLKKIEEYENKDFPEAGKIHEIIMKSNPDLHPRLWYGMPGYAKTKDSAVLCFFRKDKHISLGITESVNLEQISQGKSFTESAWFITKLDQEAETMISKIVAKATS